MFVHSFVAKCERFFEFRERGATWPTELRAGLVTFLTMSYVLVVNPKIMHTHWCDKPGHEDLCPSVDDVVVATALSSAVSLRRSPKHLPTQPHPYPRPTSGWISRMWTLGPTPVRPGSRDRLERLFLLWPCHPRRSITERSCARHRGGQWTRHPAPQRLESECDDHGLYA